MVVNNGISMMNAPVLRRLRKSSSTVGTVPTFRVVVFGQSGVGKTAMSVRFVTKRFIGEYDPTLENIYQHYYTVGNTNVLFEIMDTAGQEENDLMMEEKIRWADAFILVYAINDQTSFDEIPRLKFTITHTMARVSQQHKQVHPEPVITIVGNKTDLVPDRMVERVEGENVARGMNCAFQEISVRDGLNDVIEVFEDAYEAYKNRQAVFHSLNDSNGSLSRRKTKSFKYVDRIPRMQGKRRSYSLNSDFGIRNHVINDVASDIMTSKIDEDAEMTENIPNHPRQNGHFLNRSMSSLTSSSSDVSGPPPQAESRPPARSRRNAVIGLTSTVPNEASNGHVADDVEQFQAYRRNKLLARHSENSIPNGYHDLHGRSLSRCDTNNNSNAAPKASRRCRSQENIDLNSNGVLENFTKRAISFDVPTGYQNAFRR